jgi:hypothetical protein
LILLCNPQRPRVPAWMRVQKGDQGFELGGPTSAGASAGARAWRERDVLGAMVETWLHYCYVRVLGGGGRGAACV